MDSKIFFHALIFLYFETVEITLSLNVTITTHYTLMYYVDILHPKGK